MVHPVLCSDVLFSIRGILEYDFKKKTASRVRIVQLLFPENAKKMSNAWVKTNMYKNMSKCQCI